MGNTLNTIIGTMVILGATGAVVGLYVWCARRIDAIHRGNMTNLRQILRELGDERERRN